jgi:hypothetical protein
MRQIFSIRSVQAGVIYLLSNVAFISQAQDCDCNQVVGGCTATYKLLNIYNDPQGINSKAELQITSSVAACSKVEYFIDNTPHQTVLGNTNQAYESIFSTATITSKTVQIQACKICSSGGRAPVTVTSPSSGSTAEQMFNSALGDSSFDASQFNQELKDRADNDSMLPAIGFAIEAAKVIQQTQQVTAPSTSPSNSAGNDVYETGGGLIDVSAPTHRGGVQPVEQDRSPTKSAPCANCGVR